MIRTFRALIHVEPGFSHPEQVQTLALSLPEAQVPEPEKALRMEEDIANGLKRIPGVSLVALTSAIPMGNNSSTDLLFARDHTYREGQLPPLRRFVFVSPEVFRTMGTRLIAGRDFTWSDIDSRASVAVISESFARDYWGTAGAAVHKQIREGMNDDWREIVGVVGDIHYDGVEKKAPSAAYFPIAMNNFWDNKKLVQRNASFLIRSSRAGSESFLKEVRQIIWAVNPNLPLAQVKTMDQIYRKSMARTSFTLILLMISAAMALLLGAVGIYGVIAYSVSQRTREIGIRMALGARHGEVAGMFVRHGILLAGIGAVFGLLSASLVMRLLSTLLFAVSPVDPLTYGSMLAILLLIAAIASYLPSRRAAAIDPSTALRAD
jgi:predicted permease